MTDPASEGRITFERRDALALIGIDRPKKLNGFTPAMYRALSEAFGALEQDADGVIFPWRPGYYKPQDKKIQNEATLIVAKQRNGPVGEVDVQYEPEWSSFEDVDTSLPMAL